MPGSRLPACRAPLGMSCGAAALQTASFRRCSSGKVFHRHPGMTALLQTGFLLDLLSECCEYTRPSILACAGSAQVRPRAVFAWPVAFGPFQAPGVCPDPAWRVRRSRVRRSLCFRGLGAFAAITCRRCSPPPSPLASGTGVSQTRPTFFSDSAGLPMLFSARSVYRLVPNSFF